MNLLNKKFDAIIADKEYMKTLQDKSPETFVRITKGLYEKTYLIEHHKGYLLGKEYNNKSR